MRAGAAGGNAQPCERAVRHAIPNEETVDAG